MESTMTPTENEAALGDNSNQPPSIIDLIKFTPELEEYILANIYTKCEKPDIVSMCALVSMMDGIRATFRGDACVSSMECQ